MAKSKHITRATVQFDGICVPLGTTGKVKIVLTLTHDEADDIESVTAFYKATEYVERLFPGLVTQAALELSEPETDQHG